MKKTFIVALTAAAFSFGSLSAFAATDSQYPASDFQPKVVFIDKEAAKSAASSTGDASKCPGEQVQAKQTEFDPKYPAASFQPKVVYP
ncbi:MAG: hypothetical protein ACU84H_09865 [Gammaproteobacteria bacterium]